MIIQLQNHGYQGKESDSLTEISMMTGDTHTGSVGVIGCHVYGHDLGIKMRE